MIISGNRYHPPFLTGEEKDLENCQYNKYCEPEQENLKSIRHFRQLHN